MIQLVQATRSSCDLSICSPLRVVFDLSLFRELKKFARPHTVGQEVLDTGDASMYEYIESEAATTQLKVSVSQLILIAKSSRDSSRSTLLQLDDITAGSAPVTGTVLVSQYRRHYTVHVESISLSTARDGRSESLVAPFSLDGDLALLRNRHWRLQVALSTEGPIHIKLQTWDQVDSFAPILSWYKALNGAHAGPVAQEAAPHAVRARPWICEVKLAVLSAEMPERCVVSVVYLI